jgi:competence CoiA-like predicted nuclease
MEAHRRKMVITYENLKRRNDFHIKSD